MKLIAFVMHPRDMDMLIVYAPSINVSKVQSLFDEFYTGGDESLHEVEVFDKTRYYSKY